MKWDADKSITRLELAVGLDPEKPPGTVLMRVRLDTSALKLNGIDPKPEQTKQGHGTVWSLVIGPADQAKGSFYGHTIRQAYLRARKALKPALTKAQRTRAKERRDAKKPKKRPSD